MRLVDLTGKKFGKLTVIERTENIGNRVAWLCKCDCGNEKVVRGDDLKTGNTKSCGCYRDEFKRVHGHNTKRHGRTPEYTSWNHMMQRCYNPKNNMYEFYGAKGVTVCERWHEFKNFIEDMGEKPSTGHTIDRIDVYGNYEPSNCRWATREQQDRNVRVKITNKTGVKGVYIEKRTQKYRASIGVRGKTYQSKRFDTLEEAIQARKEMELKYWGKSSD